jgi:hypothetical protein
MTRRGGPKHHPDTRDRTRAAEALRLRQSGMTWEAIAARLKYRNPSGPRMAVERLLSRVEHEGAAQLRAVEGRRLDELQASVWGKATAGDCDAIRTVLRISERRSKLLGLDAPQRVEGISEKEFAAQAAELLRITGPGPLRELARMPELPEPVAVDCCSDGWANIGTPYETPEPAAGSLHPGADDPSPVEPAAEDDDQDAEVVVEVEAELVEDDDACRGCDNEGEVIVLEPLPRSQFRVPARDVWGRSVNPYDPLRGWRR